MKFIPQTRILLVYNRDLKELEDYYKAAETGKFEN